MTFISKLLKKHLDVMKYILISGLTAVIEALVGLIFINLFSLSAVVSNTVGTIVGAIVHYIFVTKKVFVKKIGIYSVLIYLFTFVLGLVLQNLVVWGIFKLTVNTFGKNLSYLIAKAIALVVSFIILYGVRKILYSKIPEEK